MVVEDVPQVASHVRSLLQSQTQIKMLEVVTSGDMALGSVAEMKPDVVIVDALLQGRVGGSDGAPPAAPSILDLPTDRLREQDLTDVTWRDPSGIDILLAPPRVEMAEMVTTSDIDKALSLLRQLYDFVIIDTRAALSDDVLTFLDSADLVLEVLTFEMMSIRSVAMAGETFAAIGYPIIKSPIHFEVVSDGRLVLNANNEGRPFVISNPETPIAQGVRRIADALTAHARERAPALARS